MLSVNATWHFNSKRRLWQWYGHVHLLDPHVVGQWFCLHRNSGKLRWQKRYLRPNKIAGIANDVIVATETRSDGPWTFDFGCYGISLETGDLIWVSHGNGIWGKFLRLCDFIPSYTNEFRDCPFLVADERCLCESGRVLDVGTGKQINRLSAEQMPPWKGDDSVASRLYKSTQPDAPGVEIGEELYLKLTFPSRERGPWPFTLRLIDKTGAQIWVFSIESISRHFDPSYYSFRYVPPYVYLVVSDEPRLVPHPTQKNWSIPNPTRWHMLTLNTANGQIVQDFSLEDEPMEDCRIEDADEKGILISNSKYELRYFERIG